MGVMLLKALERRRFHEVDDQRRFDPCWIFLVHVGIDKIFGGRECSHSLVMKVEMVQTCSNSLELIFKDSAT